GTEAVQLFVGGADEDFVAGEVGAGGDVGLGVVLPEGLAVGGTNAVEGAVGVADVDAAVTDGGRRLERAGLEAPLLLAVGGGRGVEVAVEGADVDDAVNDRGGSLDSVGGLELP